MGKRKSDIKAYNFVFDLKNANTKYNLSHLYSQAKTTHTSIESGSPTYNATFLQSLLQYAVENIPESLCITDLEGNAILVNNNFRKLVGLSESVPEFEINLYSFLIGSGKDDLMVRHVENIASNHWSGDITLMNAQKRREVLVSLKSSKNSISGSIYLTNIISEQLDKKEQITVETYMDMANSLPTIALGIWRLENLSGQDGNPIFRLIALNKPAQGRISPSEIRVGRTISECLQSPHAGEISRFFANVLFSGKSMEIPRFVLDQNVQFSLAAFPLQCNCVAVSFEPIKQTEVPSELYYEAFEYVPAMCGIFQKDPEGNDYYWKQSNAMGRAQRKDSFVPPTNAKLSTLVPTFNSPQLLAAVEKLKPGQFIKLLVNDWTQDMYHFCLVQGRITKLHSDFLFLHLEPLSPDTIRKHQSILNRATQGTYIDDDVKDIWFFYKTVQPIDSMDTISIEVPTVTKPQPPPLILPNIPSMSKLFNTYPTPPTIRSNYYDPTIEPPAEFFKRAFYESSTGLCMLNPQGTFITVNNALCQSLGYSTEEFLTNSFVPLTHPEDVEKSTGLHRQMLNGEIHCFHMIKRYLHKRGHIVWCLISTAIVRDSNTNKPLFIVTQIVPVDTWRNLLMGPDLKRDEEMQSELINEAPIGCCTVSKDGIICSVNQYICDRVGYSMYELIGKPLLILFPKEEQEAMRSYIHYSLKNSDAKPQTWNLIRFAGKNGKETRAFTFLMSLVDTKGMTVHLAMFMQDSASMPKAANTQWPYY